MATTPAARARNQNGNVSAIVLTPIGFFLHHQINSNAAGNVQAVDFAASANPQQMSAAAYKIRRRRPCESRYSVHASTARRKKNPISRFFTSEIQATDST